MDSAREHNQDVKGAPGVDDHELAELAETLEHVAASGVPTISDSSSQRATDTGIGPDGAAPKADGIPAPSVEGGRKYQVGDVVGAGGMGAILAAKDLSCRRTVAMKVMLGNRNASDDDLIRFIEEAQITAQLEHPNIVPVHELGANENGDAFYTMKLVEGVDLKQVLAEIAAGNRKTIETYPLNRLLTIFLRVCDAVAFAHSRGVIHRDLKPANVMLGDYGEVLVMDWGLAKVLRTVEGGRRKVEGEPRPDSENVGGAVLSGEPSPPPSTSHPQPDTPAIPISSIRHDRDRDLLLTMDGQVLGTPSFMAPEQALGKTDELDARTDIYALGAILYSILALRPPVEGRTTHHVLMKVAKGEITPPTAFNETSTAPRVRKASNASVRDVRDLQKRASTAAAKSLNTETRNLKPPFPHCPGNRIPAALSAVAMKALALDPDDRYLSVSELQREIEAYQHGFATEAEQARCWRQLLLLVSRHRAVCSAVALSGVLLLASLAWFVASVSTAKAKATAKGIAARDALGKLRTLTDDAIPEFAARAEDLLDKGDFGGARRSAVAAISLASSPTPAHYCMAALSALCDRLYSDAAEFARRALEMAPDSAAARGVFEVCRKARKDSGLKDGQTNPSVTREVAGLLYSIDRLGPAWSLLRGVEEVNRLDRSKMKRIYLDRIREAVPGILTRSDREVIISSTEFSVNLRAFQDLSDLRFLAGMPLTSLSLGSTAVADLSPLQGMPLRHLDTGAVSTRQFREIQGVATQYTKDGSPVRDLGPLKGLPLETLLIDCPQVTDISALAGLPLTSLGIRKAKIRSLGPLSGMRLEILDLLCCGLVSDLGPLKGMPLKKLVLSHTAVVDLTPLKGMPLVNLQLDYTPVSDIGVLRGMPLEVLSLSITNVRNIDSLQGLPLRNLSLWDCPIRDIGVLRDMPLQTLALGSTGVRDLDVLRGMGLTSLNLWSTPVADLSPLAGMHLTSLRLGRTKVTDISVLRGMPLEVLGLDGCEQLQDLSPLAECPTLRELHIPERFTDIEFLRDLPNLQVLSRNENDHTRVEEFWRRFDAARSAQK